MKLERLTENKIKYTISLEELADKGFLDTQFDSFIWENLFDEMVEKAEEEYDVEISETITLEIFSLNETEVTLILTLNYSDEEVDTELSLLIPEKQSERMVYLFTDIEDVITFACEARNLNMTPTCQLFTYVDYYYLLIPAIQDDKLEVLLSEFGQKSHYSDKWIAQHAKVLVPDDAILFISRVFDTSQK